jgi:hypothetical protein
MPAPLQDPAPTLFQTALGDKWQELPPCVRRLHSVQDVERFSGHARVTRGRGLVARMAAFIFGFPEAGDDVPLIITKTRTPAGETWERDFDGRRFRSVLTPSVRPQHYRERFGPFTYEQELPVEEGVLHFPVRRGWFLGIRLPSLLLPRSCSREFAVDGAFHFDIGLYAPVAGGLIVRYQGRVGPQVERAPGGDGQLDG